MDPLADLSAYILAGRVKDARAGLVEGDAAEAVGLRRVWLSERYDLKEAGALLGGIAGRTERLGVATAAIAPGSRHPLMTAALGATMQNVYGGRFTLGIARGSAAVLDRIGMRPFTFRATADYVDIVRRLWRGETVTYDGPAGRFPALKLVDALEGEAPQVWSVNLGGEQASRWAARAFDGVFLTPMLTPEAVAKAVGWIRDECDKLGRDPAEVPVCQGLVTAPEMNAVETREVAHARAVTYLQWPGIWQRWVELNGWDRATAERIRAHELFSGLKSSDAADQHFHRSQLSSPAQLVPDEWMQQTCALGSIDACVETMRQFKAAGADEIALYGSTIEQNAKLISAWRGTAE